MSKEEVRHQKASDRALWMSVDSEFVPRQEEVSLPLAQVSGNILDSKPQSSSGNSE